MKKKFSIDGIQIGDGQPVFVIAEAGVNHNGDVDLAKRLIHEAQKVGADCVKFQTFNAERVVTQNAPKAAYQINNTDPKESQINMLRKLELPLQSYPELIKLCRKLGVVFLSTPYNVEDIDFLDNMGVTAYKLASIHLVEPYIIQYVASKGKPMIVSTGMATQAEVEQAVATLNRSGNDQFVLLQCTTDYPSALEDTNLLAMQTMREAFDTLVGYSDHTQNLTAATVAIGLGACVIERHFTLDRSLPGPDHSCSSEPEEFRQLVKQIREAEICLGSRLKSPTERELKNARIMRRSLVARHAIPAGTKLSWHNLTFKRPADGLSGQQADLILGKTARCKIDADQIITLDMIK